MGYEIANFYFWNEENGKLNFFEDELLNSGLVLPFFTINGLAKDGSFDSARIGEEDFKNRRNIQKIKIRKNELTSNLCFQNLQLSNPRRSQTEAKRDWLLIPQGEIVLFIYEFILRQELTNSGINNISDAESELSNTNLAIICWDKIHSEKYKNMVNRNNQDLEQMTKWIERVLNNNEEYKYLFLDDKSTTNWFIHNPNRIRTIINKHKQNTNEYLRQLSMAIITDTYSTNNCIDLKSVKYFSRSRIMPEMELLHGSHNTMCFILRFFYPQDMAEGAKPIQAFLLGTFYDETFCNDFYIEIKNLFNILALRDVQNLSLRKLPVLLGKLRETERVMSTLSNSVFLHGIKKPLALIGSNVRFIKRNINNSNDANKIQEALDIIDNQQKKGLWVIDVSRQIAELAGPGEEEEFELCEYVAVSIKEIKDEMKYPESLVINVRKGTNAINVLMKNKNTLKIVLENLLSNACDAMDEKGSINVDVTETKNAGIIKVTDSGPGIDKKILPHIFSPFITTKTEQGMNRGLGLYLSEHLLQLQKGSLNAINIENNGAQFIVTLIKTKGEN